MTSAVSSVAETAPARAGPGSSSTSASASPGAGEVGRERPAEQPEHRREQVEHREQPEHDERRAARGDAVGVRVEAHEHVGEAQRAEQQRHHERDRAIHVEVARARPPAGTPRPGGSSAGGRRRRPRAAARTTGTASAVSLSQNWNACTNVIERMPPAATTTRDDHGDGDRADPRGQSRRDAHREGRALQLRHDVEPADHDHEEARDPARPPRLEPRLGEVGDRVGARAPQRRRHEQQQHEVPGGVADREPQGVGPGEQDEPGDAEERRRREVLAADRRGVPPRAHGARGDVEVARRARDAQAVEADERRRERDGGDRGVADDGVHGRSCCERER